MSRCGECKLGCNEEGALYCEENLGYEQCIDRLQDALFELSADRQQGKWIEGRYVDSEWISPTADFYKCSICGKIVNLFQMCSYSFCPNCGARMKGVNNGEDIQSADE